MKKYSIAAAAVLCGLLPSLAVQAQSVEKPDVSIAVGGKVALYYLPLTIAEVKGYFKDEGLNARVLDFQGGSKSVQAVAGGSADILSSAFEHVINLQAKDQHLTAFVLQGRYPGFALSVAKSKADKYNTPADLKGMKIGVTAPGSSTHMMVNLLLSQVGMTSNDVSIIGVGAGASVLAAMKNGQVDAVVQADPATSMLVSGGAAIVKVDTRTEAGTKAVYGGPMPAASFSAQDDFIKKNPKTIQALTNAMVRALRFINKSTDEELLAAIPDEALLGGARSVYVKMIPAVRPSYSPDGVISQEAAQTALNVLTAQNPALQNTKIDLARTYDNSFVNKVPKDR